MSSAKVEKLVEVLDGLDYDTQIEMWNTYDDLHIYRRTELDEVLADKSPSEIAEAIAYSEYEPTYDYFYVDNGSIISCHSLDIGDLYDLAEYIIDGDNDFGIDEITEILEK